jgi:Putative transposase
MAFDGRPGVAISAPLSVREAGFSLHAATRAGAADEQGREALLKYILRPPLATERLLPGPDGLVRIALKKPFSDGTVAVDLDPLSLLCRLVALVPAPRFHTVRYSGVLAAASKWRPLIVPKHPTPDMDELEPRRDTHRLGRPLRNSDRLRPHELRLQHRLAVLKQHRNHLLEVRA